MEDLTGKSTGPGGADTQLTAVEWNNFFQELKNLIEDTGQTMSVGNLDQLALGVSEYTAAAHFYTGGGSANTYTLTPLTNIEGIVAYRSGQTFQFRPNNTNTGASTAAVNGLAATSILREDGSALSAGDISTTRDCIIRYNGVNFLVLEGTLAAPSGPYPDRYIDGLVIRYDQPAVSSNIGRFSVLSGKARDETNSSNLVLGSDRIKDFNSNVTVGGQGLFYVGLPRTASLFYRLFLVGKTDGTVEIGLDTLANDDASGLRTYIDGIDAVGWNYYRQIGWIFSRSTTNLSGLQQSEFEPNYHFWTEDIDAQYANILSFTGNDTIETFAFAATDNPAIDGIEAEAEVQITPQDITGWSSGTSECKLGFWPDYMDTDHIGLSLSTDRFNWKLTSDDASDPADHDEFMVRVGVLRIPVDSNRAYSARVNVDGTGVTYDDFRIALQLTGFRWKR